VAFYRGAIDQVFNRLDRAVLRLRSYLEEGGNGPPTRLRKEAWLLLADAFRRLGRYREAADAFRQVVSRFGPGLEKGERASCESYAGFWSVVAEVPPQAAEIRTDATIRMANRRFPVAIKDRTFLFGYDTGCNMSILYKSAADELGLAIWGPPIKVYTSTGESVDARIGVVPELRLESVLIKNTIFFILPDELFHSGAAPSGTGTRGLLGMPVLEALKEITETGDGRLVVPALPQPRSEQNMCFSGFMPVVEVLFREARLSLCLDTGSSATYLYPPFLRRYFGEVKSRSRARKATVRGVGSPRAVAVHILDEFAFRAGGRDLALRKVSVHAQVTHPDTRRFLGTLGIDVLSQCSRMTLNFVSMSFSLE
jgi:hypothetical protein